MKNSLHILALFFGLVSSTAVYSQSNEPYKLEINITDFKNKTTIAQLYKSFEQNIKVLSYSIEYNSNGLNSAHLENGRLSGALKKTILAEFPNQTKVSITNVKAKTADGKLIDVKPLIVTLIQ